MCINLPWILYIELLRSIFGKQYANSPGCSVQTFLSPYIIHHTIPKWDSDLWFIRCPLFLLRPNKTAAHCCLWNIKSYKCEALDKYQTSSPHRPTLDYFLKAFTSFMFQAVPQKSQPWTGEGYTLCSQQRLMSHRAPAPTAWPARTVSASRVFLIQRL